MSILDDKSLYPRLDPSGMRNRIRELPHHCQIAWGEGMDFPLSEEYRRINRIVILGMGGSAIGGDLLRSLVALESPVPVFVERGYDLPYGVDASTLVVASSYSGNTEETLSAFGQALATPARKLAVTTGGRLGELTQASNVPTLEIIYKAEPRAALAYSFIPLVAICQRLGIIKDKKADLDEAVETMNDWLLLLDERSPLAANHAKAMAEKLQGKLAVIYGAGHLSEVARRWKTQVNENSKAWAVHDVLPELDHNSVVGYQFPKELLERIYVVMLRSPSLHPRVLARYQVTGELLEQAGVAHETVEARGVSPLAQMMSALLFGDWVSYYLALLNGVDPSPVPAIDYLKGRLAAM